MITLACLCRNWSSVFVANRFPPHSLHEYLLQHFLPALHEDLLRCFLPCVPQGPVDSLDKPPTWAALFHRFFHFFFLFSLTFYSCVWQTNSPDQQKLLLPSK